MLITRDMVSDKVWGLFNVPNPKKVTAIKLGNNAQWIPDKEEICSGQFLPPGAAFWAVMLDDKVLDLPAVEPGRLGFKKSVELFDYQQPIFEDVKDLRAAMIELTTGGGKSVIAAKLVEHWASETLILCHTKQMVDQFAETFQEFLGVKIGKFYTGKKELLPITATTFASAVANQKVFEEAKFTNLIVDECDTFFSKKRRKFLNTFPTIRKFGFTGTVRVPDYDDLIKNAPCVMERMWGYRCTGKPEKPCVLKEIKYFHYDKTYEDEDGIPICSADWHVFRDALDKDEDRLDRQFKWIFDNVEKGDHALVLYDRVSHVDELHNISFGSAVLDMAHEQDVIPVHKVHGQLDNKTRESQVEGFKEMGGVLFAQKATSGRGVDYPSCNKLFILFPVKNESSLRQLVGRAIRWKEGKQSIIYDWIDHSLYGQWKKRIATYTEHFPDAEIIEQKYLD